MGMPLKWGHQNFKFLNRYSKMDQIFGMGTY